MMRKFNIIMLCAAFVLFCLSSAFADEGKEESGKGKFNKDPYAEEYSKGKDDGKVRGKNRSYSEEYGRNSEGESYFHQHGYDRLNIPKGHYPSPGECRIWYPDKPAGHQPPPGKCSELRSQVPPGAWLIRHPEDEAERVHVMVYDERRPDTVRVTGEFDTRTGGFIRIIFNK